MKWQYQGSFAHKILVLLSDRKKIHTTIEIERAEKREPRKKGLGITIEIERKNFIYVCVWG